MSVVGRRSAVSVVGEEDSVPVSVVGRRSAVSVVGEEDSVRSGEEVSSVCSGGGGQCP